MSSVGVFGKGLPEDSLIGSPLKRARPSISDISELKTGSTFPPALGDILAKAEAAQAAQNKPQPSPPVREVMEEEEL